MLILVLTIKGQEEIKFNTPELSALAKYIESPVNYSNGLVDISIPLYEINVENITIPIVLKYHHGGLKASEESHWLGQGWTLQAEPSIGVSVNGYYNSMYHRDLDDPSFNTERAQSDYAYKMSNSTFFDEAPDQYIYSLLNKSGSFYFKYDGVENNTKKFKAVTSPYEPIKIRKLSEHIFEITDDNGVIYKFYSENAREIIEGINEVSTTLWKCTSIITPTNNNITFTYQEHTFETYRPTDMVILDDYSGTTLHQTSERHALPFFIKSGIRVSSIGKNHNGIWSNPMSFIEKEWAYTSKDPYSKGPNSYPSKQDPRTISRTPKIKKIEFKTGVVEFYEGAKGDKNYLNAIEIKNKSGQLIRRIQFNNSFIKRNDKNVYLPMLNSIDIQDNMRATVERYSMEYNGDPIIADRYTFVNFWGYKAYQSPCISDYCTLFPKTDLPVYLTYSSQNGIVTGETILSVGSSEFNSKVVATQGMLKSITNPAGCKTEYTYEPGYYREFVPKGTLYPNNTFNIRKGQYGVLRIKEIMYKDPLNGIRIIRNFKYGMEKSKEEFYDGYWSDGDIYTGMGIVKRQIYPEDHMTTIIKNDETVAWYEVNGIRRRTLRSSLIGDRTYSGSPIVYNQVTEFVEKIENGIITDNGKTVYHYNFLPGSQNSYFNNYMNQTYGVYMDPKIDWRYGQLVSKEYLKRENNEEYKLISKTNYDYRQFDKDYIKIGVAARFVISRATPSNPNNLFYEDYSKTYYNVYTGAIRISSETDSLFADNGITVSKVEYKYDNPEHLYPTEIKTSNSNNKTKIVKKSYPLDASTQIDSEHLAAKAELVKRGIISPVLENKEITDVGNITTFNSYKIFPNLLPLFHKTIIKKDNLDQETRFTCTHYDNYGNPLFINKDNATNVVYLWSYNGQYPVAEIRNATYQEVSSALGGDAEITRIGNSISLSAADILKINNLRSNVSLKDAHITTYTYKQLVGALTITDPSGLTTYYEYDGFGRLQRIKDSSNNKLEEYAYYYRSNSDSQTSLLTPLVRFNTENQDNSFLRDAYIYRYWDNRSSSYNGYSNNIFSVNVTDGSGNYRYSWTLRNSNNQILASQLNSTSFSYNVNFETFGLGFYQLTCEVTDTATGLIGLARHNFKVYTEIGFSNIILLHDKNSSGGRFEIRGDILGKQDVMVRLRLKVYTNINVGFGIGGTYYTISSGEQIVELTIPFGGSYAALLFYYTGSPGKVADIELIDGGNPAVSYGNVTKLVADTFIETLSQQQIKTQSFQNVEEDTAEILQAEKSEIWKLRIMELEKLLKVKDSVEKGIFN